ncbi:hypothetical protein [Elizabethkingia ursingii]|uniref:hypothetical protein n=1 Tax=Elizabethkingia ursingii TaxID=1756150 RepID=UPI002011922A|nr:hypothetical protein [Elizabethkingia ursingii]MCL1671760.1 hypothetical protein [Elizabethkingia ursingii]
MKKNLLSKIALIVSLASLFFVIFRIKPIVWDWMAILVGILSLLVTVLLGWQLYQIFNINKIEEKLKHELDVFRGETEGALLLMYNSSLDTYRLNKDHMNFINITIHCVEKALKLGNLGIANGLANQAIDIYPNGIGMSNFYKSIIVTSFYAVKGWNKLDRYREFEDLVLNKITITEQVNKSQLDYVR